MPVASQGGAQAQRDRARPGVPPGARVPTVTITEAGPQVGAHAERALTASRRIGPRTVPSQGLRRATGIGVRAVIDDHGRGATGKRPESRSVRFIARQAEPDEQKILRSSASNLKL